MALLVVLALCACGRFGFDALGDDTGGEEEEVAFGPASLTLLTPSGGLQDRSVVFHDSDGAVLAVQPTGPGGMAVAEIPTGASVTVTGDGLTYLGGPSLYRLYTVMGLEPGDALTLGSEFDPWDGAGEVQVALPGPAAGAAWYYVDIGCDNSKTDTAGQTIFLELDMSCFRGVSTFDIIAYAEANDGALIGQTTLKGVSIDPGGQTVVTLPSWTTLPISTTELTLTNAPPGVLGVDVNQYAVAGGVSFYTDDDGDEASGGAIRLFLDVPSGFADGVEYLMSVYHEPIGNRGDSSSYPMNYALRRQAGVPTSIEHDLSAFLLPPILDVGLDATTPDRPEISLLTGGDLSATDGALAIVTWEDELQNGYEWWILLPPGVTRFTVPELPDFLANYRPSASRTFSPPTVVAIDADFIADWDEMRNRQGLNFFLAPQRNRGDDWLVRASASPGGYFSN